MSGGRLFVGGVPYEWGLTRLENIFTEYGKVLDIHLKKGFAFIEFDRFEDAKRAIHGTDHGKKFGQRVTVEFANRERLDEKDEARLARYRYIDDPRKRETRRYRSRSPRYDRRSYRRDRSRSPRYDRQSRRHRSRERSYSPRYDAENRKSRRERSPEKSRTPLSDIETRKSRHERSPEKSRTPLSDIETRKSRRERSPEKSRTPLSDIETRESRHERSRSRSEGEIC